MPALVFRGNLCNNLSVVHRGKCFAFETFCIIMTVQCHCKWIINFIFCCEIKLPSSCPGLVSLSATRRRAECARWQLWHRVATRMTTLSSSEYRHSLEQIRPKSSARAALSRATIYWHVSYFFTRHNLMCSAYLTSWLSHDFVIVTYCIHWRDTWRCDRAAVMTSVGSA